MNLLFILDTLGGGHGNLRALPIAISMAGEIKMVLENENSRLMQYRISAILVVEPNAQGDTDCIHNTVPFNSGAVL